MNKQSHPTLACTELPQARFNAFGAGALSDTELIALLLEQGTRSAEVFRVASQLLAEAGSLPVLFSWPAEDLQRLKGIGESKAKRLVAAGELARRLICRQRSPNPIFNRPEIVFEHLLPITTGLAIEKFWVACLNRKNRLIKLVEITSGTATSSLAHPREVFRAAIRYGSTAVVCIHNHPSGDPAPSSADLQITRQLREAARTVDIELLDHVVIGHPECDPHGTGWHSFRSSGVL